MGQLIALKRESVMLPLDTILEPEFQLRVHYDEAKLLELGNSLEAEGMFYPLLVNDRDGKYELIIGSRRKRAAQLKGFLEVPAIVLKIDDPAHVLRIALTENLQRQDLDPFEEARGFLRLIYEYKMSQKEVATSLSQSEQFINKRLALLALPEAVQELIAKGKLGLHYVSTIVRIPTGQDQTRYAQLAVEKNLTQAELKAYISQEKDHYQRVVTKGVSIEKIIARVAIQKRWFRNISGKMNFRNMTAQERSRIVDALRDLETAIRTTRELVAIPAQVFGQASSSVRADSSPPNNHGQEWTTRDLKRISASDRAGDDVLAKQLGRTPAAIAAMRSKSKG